MYEYVFKTRQKIARELGINRRTLYDKLKYSPIDLPKGLVSSHFQQKIYDYFGIYQLAWGVQQKHVAREVL